MEVVDFLCEPDRPRTVGALIPRGVLLYWAPCTERTLLARAVAGEAKVVLLPSAGAAAQPGGAVRRVRRRKRPRGGADHPAGLEVTEASAAGLEVSIGTASVIGVAGRGGLAGGCSTSGSRSPSVPWPTSRCWSYTTRHLWGAISPAPR